MSDDMRDFTRGLFGRQEPTEPVPADTSRNNVSPREGNNPNGTDPDQPMRDFVRDLFTPID